MNGQEVWLNGNRDASIRTRLLFGQGCYLSTVTIDTILKIDTATI